MQPTNPPPPHSKYGLDLLGKIRMDWEGGYSCFISADFTWQKRDAPWFPCLSGNGGVMASRSLALVLVALLCLRL